MTVVFTAHFLLPGYLYGQVLQLDSNEVRFGRVLTGQTKTLELGFTNTSSQSLNVRSLRLSDTSHFSVRLLDATVASGARGRIELMFYPDQNVTYQRYLFLQLDRAPGTIPVLLRGSGRFEGNYYKNTRDLYDIPLRQALKQTVQSGALQLGYSDARDRMYMQIDNQKDNGQNASQNTIECVYTGEQQTGYTDRRDAQSSNPRFNTEHTFPQSKYDSDEPMRSDLHHLFPTRVYVNSERSNHPFAEVNNASFTAGGSRSNGREFEPRNAQKGPSARAMMYFVVRYQDYDNFYRPQENILLKWHRNFPPDEVEKQRNEDIFRYQKNRNPFVDHPEFMERMSSLVGASSRPNVRRAIISADTLRFGQVFPEDTQRCTLYVAAGGNQTLGLSNWRTSSDQFAVKEEASFLEPQEGLEGLLAVPLAFSGTQLGANSATLSFLTTDANNTQVEVALEAEVIEPTGVDETARAKSSFYCSWQREKRIACSWEGNPIEALQVHTPDGRLLARDTYPGLRNKQQIAIKGNFSNENFLIISVHSENTTRSFKLMR